MINIKKKDLMLAICEDRNCSDSNDEQYPGCDLYKKNRCTGKFLFNIIRDRGQGSSPVHNQVSQPGDGGEGGPQNAGESVSEMKFQLQVADAVMKAIDETIERGDLDSRSMIADVRLNYSVPFTYHYLKG